MRNPFLIPTPAELGYNSNLPSEFFGDHDEGEYTWEQYYKEMQERYPIRYFFSETLPRWVRRIANRFDNAIYWVKCHTLNEYRFHLLELSNDEYKWGWIDADRQILFANFRILCNYVEKELDSKLNREWSEEDMLDPVIVSQVEFDHQIKALYYFWKVERLSLIKANDDALHNWAEGRKTEDSVQLMKLSNEAEQKLLDSEDESLIKLIKLRHRMWT